ncbi:MAG: sulfite exporter TauE/SafE family protein [Planctomycetaceae bacterium]
MTATGGLLAASLAIVALVYASIGHAGATGFIAVMAMAGVEPDVIRPTALGLNVVVAAIATVQFWRAGHIQGRLFVPLASGSLPAALLGGYADPPTAFFEFVVGCVLLASAISIVRGIPSVIDRTPDVHRRLPFAILIVLGIVLGLLSGLTGVGGGVFLTPTLLAINVAPVRQVAAVSAPFILVNSIAGLTGAFVAGRSFPPLGIAMLVSVAVGGLIGSQLGAFRLPAGILRGVMGVVLVVAGMKLCLSGLR